LKGLAELCPKQQNMRILKQQRAELQSQNVAADQLAEQMAQMKVQLNIQEASMQQESKEAPRQGVTIIADELDSQAQQAAQAQKDDQVQLAATQA
jgi:hypothetical protein